MTANGIYTFFFHYLSIATLFTAGTSANCYLMGDPAFIHEGYKFMQVFLIRIYLIFLRSLLFSSKYTLYSFIILPFLISTTAYFNTGSPHFTCSNNDIKNPKLEENFNEAIIVFILIHFHLKHYEI